MINFRSIQNEAQDDIKAVQHAPVSLNRMAEEFRCHLAKIREKSVPAKFLKKFRTCTDDEREKCASILMDLAMLMPSNVAHYADTARDINVMCDSVASSEQNNFAFFLNKIGETRVQLHFQQKTKDWKHIRLIGVFVSHLYIRNFMRASLLANWLEGVEFLIPKHYYTAYDVLIEILEIVLPNMKAKSPLLHSHYCQTLKQWEKTLKNSTSVEDDDDDDEATSSTSMHGSVSSNSSLVNSGAIRKT